MPLSPIIAKDSMPTSGFAVGDLIFSNTDSVVGAVADIAAGNVLLSAGVGVVPAFGKVTSGHVDSSVVVVPSTSTTLYGLSAGSGQSGTQVTAIGSRSAYNNTGSAVSVYGYGAGEANTGVSLQAFGYSSAENNTGEQVLALGRECGFDNTGNYCVFIGYGAGDGNTSHNQFVLLHSTVSATPLLSGNFSTGAISLFGGAGALSVGSISNLGTPSSGTLTNCTGLPISTGVSGLGTGVATFLATPSSANLRTAITDETGSGALVFATSPTLVTPAIGAATGTSVTLTATGTTAIVSDSDGQSSGGSKYGMRARIPGRAVAANETNTFIAMQATGQYSANSGDSFNIAAGVTDSGSREGFRVESFANNSAFLGTLASQIGAYVRVGQTGSSAGTITNTYGIYLEHLIAVGTFTNLYGVYQATANANITNYFGSKISCAAGITSTSATAGIGYATGAGGTVTQATSRTTGVTINKVCGQITTHTASLAAGASAKFTVTNSAVAATDGVLLTIASGTTTDATVVRVQSVAAGSFTIVVDNTHASTAETGAIVINFQVFKGVTA